jgi:hypothetical protein
MDWMGSVSGAAIDFRLRRVAMIKFSTPSLPLVLLVFTLVSWDNPVRADDLDLVIRPGVYHGQWHGDKVKIIIEEVGRDEKFSGIVHFDKESRFPDAIFLFTGEIGHHKKLTIRRDPNNDPQVARTEEPTRHEGHLVWKGEVTGEDLDKAYPFELRIPIPK